jgi:hypothetical protein
MMEATVTRRSGSCPKSDDLVIAGWSAGAAA